MPVSLKEEWGVLFLPPHRGWLCPAEVLQLLDTGQVHRKGSLRDPRATIGQPEAAGFSMSSKR